MEKDENDPCEGEMDPIQLAVVVEHVAYHDLTFSTKTTKKPWAIEWQVAIRKDRCGQHRQRGLSRKQTA